MNCNFVKSRLRKRLASGVVKAALGAMSLICFLAVWSLAASLQIAISGFSYVPSKAHISPGDTVIWVNRDLAEHTVTEDNGRWESDLLGRGNIYSFVFTGPGVYPYHSRTYPFMRDTITVEANIGEYSQATPGHFELFSNQPNPFNDRTDISFALGGRGRATLEIFDVLGRRIGVLVNGMLDPGIYTVGWDAGERPSGVFFYRLTFNGETRTSRMTLLK